MAGVGIERDVGDQPETGELLLDRAAGAADEVALIERFAAFLVLEAALGVREDGGDGRLCMRRRFAFVF